MTRHLPILLVIVPFIAAILGSLLRRRSLALGWALTATWSTFGLAVMLLLRVLHHGTLSYEIGGWAAPWGIEYRADPLAAFVALFVAAIGAVVLGFSPASLDREIPRHQQPLFLTMYLLCLSGLLGMTITGDLFNLFVFLEISSLSSYTMISLGRDRRALTSALQYLLLGTIGAAFIVIGIGMLYQMTGTLNMADAATRLPAVEGMRTVLAAFGFLTVGIALKMALFPLHPWLPNAYTYAPSVVTAFLAATATKVSVYVLVRFVFSIFGRDFAFEQLSLDALLMPLALIGIFVMSTVAIFQSNVKRMLAYSSVAQVGYMVLGISFASVTGLTAGIVHLFNHALMKGGLFLALGSMALRLGSVELCDLRGIGRRMPWTTAAWVLGGLGLIGVPATAGFITKWYLIRAALERQWWPIAVLVLLSSLLALAYVWRVVETAYFQPVPEGAPAVREAPPPMLAATWLLIGASLAFGLNTTWSVGVARRAAEALLAPAPIVTVAGAPVPEVQVRR